MKDSCKAPEFRCGAVGEAGAGGEGLFAYGVQGDRIGDDPAG